MFDSAKATSTTMNRNQSITNKVKMKRPEIASDRWKRAFDIMLSAFIIVFLMPALLAIAALVKMDSRGPVFFRQRRTGLDGRVFHIFKFRSMTVAEDGDKVVQAVANDQRVTRVGKILRRTSLDEIPQVFNIFLGDMSFVGPRPHAMAHDAEFAKIVPDYGKRFGARPGLTGLAQVRGFRGEILTGEDLENRIAADIEYIESWSFYKDVFIVLATVPVLFGHKNAY